MSFVLSGLPKYHLHAHTTKNQGVTTQIFMPITFLSFGPRKCYTMVYKNGWHTSANEGSSVLALKQGVEGEGGTIHSFAFGEGGSWFISYDLPDGKSRWR